ncbi:HTH-type transcriptional regulator ygjM [Escherichia coli]|nr:HTH-type transcriptional regulator ygjM [Escherichia coli]
MNIKTGMCAFLLSLVLPAQATSFTEYLPMSDSEYAQKRALKPLLTMPYDASKPGILEKWASDTLLQREQRMTANAARAVKATRELVNAVPFLGGSDSEDDYREALELVEYLIEEDDTNPLIDFLASRIAEYENNNEKFAEFDKAVAAMPVGVALLRTLIDQHNLTYADLKNEIGSKSLVSQILSGQRSLTISHIKALSARFGVKPEWFL